MNTTNHLSLKSPQINKSSASSNLYKLPFAKSFHAAIETDTARLSPALNQEQVGHGAPLMRDEEAKSQRDKPL